MLDLLYTHLQLGIPKEDRDAWVTTIERPPMRTRPTAGRRRRRRRRSAAEARAIADQVDRYDREVTRGR